MEKFEFFNKLKDNAFFGYWQKRIISELEFLLEASKAEGGIYNEELLACAEKLYGIYEKNGAITKADAINTEAELSHFGKIAKSYDVSCVAHAHIDMNWMWGFQETACVSVDTFRTMLRLMDEYPEFIFSQSQASVYNIIEKYYPEMLEKIKARVKEGRWEITASSWVENDKNMSGAEAMSRHLLYTKRYLAKLFSFDEDELQIDFEPDTFGHNENMPEILANGGVKYYYHCRAYSGEYIYNWEAPSGQKILVFREPTWYNQEIDANLFVNVPAVCKRVNTKNYLKVYGVGDHGGGPTRRDIERLIDMAGWPLMPVIHFSTLKDYFRKIEKERDNFPTVKQELNYIFTGCYTSQSKIKRANKIGEDRLYASEVLDAQAKLTCPDYKTASPYEKAWRKILFNQFHDILPGSGVSDTREYALGEFQKAVTTADINASHAMESICKNIDTSSIDAGAETEISVGAGVGFGTADGDGYRFPTAEAGKGSVRIYNIFNPANTDREEAVDITLWDFCGGNDTIKAYDTDGNELELQSFGQDFRYWGHSYAKIAVFAKVPALGYTTVIIKKQKTEHNYTNGDPCDHFSDAPIVLENDKIFAEFKCETMELTKLIDKRTGKNYISEPSCSLRFIYEENMNGMSSWRVGKYMNTVNINRERPVHITSEWHGKLRSGICYSTDIENSAVSVSVTLDKGSSCLKFAVSADWREFGSKKFIPQLQFYAPVAADTPVSRCAVPFGTIDRPALDHDVPCTGFMAVPDGDKAVILMSDCKYGFRNFGKGMLCDLIRSSDAPDSMPEIGNHPITLGFGLSDYSGSSLLTDCAAFVNPISTFANSVHTGALPASMSAVKIENAQISAIKQAENGEGIVVRLYNPEDTAANAMLTFCREIKSAEAVTITEKKLADLTAEGNTMSVEINPHAIKTVCVKFINK